MPAGVLMVVTWGRIGLQEAQGDFLGTGDVLFFIWVVITWA